MLNRFGITCACALALLATAGSPARAAGGMNDYSCELDPARPYPVILVHGRGGDVAGFATLIDALTTRGYCVFAINYGQTGGEGSNGHDHLTVSGAQMNGFIDHVLAHTGAARVDVIAHSAGTGVVNNVILEKQSGHKINRFVSFGGLHHPYAHAGVGELVDGSLFLPNLIKSARIIFPNITAQEIIVLAINIYDGAGGSLAGIDAETATSNFAADLFEPIYWEALHGGLSEAPGNYVTLGASRRSLPTRDSVPGICYTNIVGIADTLTGPAAGFQDEAPNVVNFLLMSSADHAQLLDDPVAVTRALDALATPCTPPPVDPDTPGTDDTADPGDDTADPGDDSDDSTEGDGDYEDPTLVASSCRMSHGGSGSQVLLLLAAAGLVARRRRTT